MSLLPPMPHWTPAMACAQQGDVETLAVLLRHQVAIDDDGDTGVTPLALACMNGRLTCGALLLAHGADVERSCADGWTPLMIASFYGHEDVVQLLLDHRASVDRVTPFPHLSAVFAEGHFGALMAACLGRNETARARVVTLLLAHGADPNRSSANGMGPLMVAAKKSDPACVALLLAAGAEVDKRNDKGGTALMCAAHVGSVACVAALLVAGADVHAQTRWGWTSVDFAARAERLDALSFLLAHGGKAGRSPPFLPPAALAVLARAKPLRTAYCWHCVRDAVRARGVVMYWMQQTCVHGCAEGGVLRLRDAAAYEAFAA